MPPGDPVGTEPKGGLAVQSVRLSTPQLVFFNRQISSMVRMDLPLAKGLKSLARDVKSPRFRRVLEGIQVSLEQGLPLHASLAPFPEVFPPVYLEVVKAGEASGNLAASLEDLAEHFERMESIVGRVKSIAAYPFIVAIFLGVFAIGLLIGIVPKMRETYEQILSARGTEELPAVSAFLLNLSEKFQSPWTMLLLLGIVFGSVGVFIRQIRSAEGTLAEWLLHVPLFRVIFRGLILMRICRTISDLLKSGLPLVTALQHAARGAGNNRYRRILQDVRRDVEAGRPLFASPVDPADIPETMLWKLQAAEQRGILEEAFLEQSEALEKELESSVNISMRVLEPLLIIVLAVCVALLFLSVYLPLIQASTLR